MIVCTIGKRCSKGMAGGGGNPQLYCKNLTWGENKDNFPGDDSLSLTLFPCLDRFALHVYSWGEEIK